MLPFAHALPFRAARRQRDTLDEGLSRALQTDARTSTFLPPMATTSHEWAGNSMPRAKTRARLERESSANGPVETLITTRPKWSWATSILSHPSVRSADSTSNAPVKARTNGQSGCRGIAVPSTPHSALSPITQAIPPPEPGITTAGLGRIADDISQKLSQGKLPTTLHPRPTDRWDSLRKRQLLRCTAAIRRQVVTSNYYQNILSPHAFDPSTIYLMYIILNPFILLWSFHPFSCQTPR